MNSKSLFFFIITVNLFLTSFSFSQDSLKNIQMLQEVEITSSRNERLLKNSPEIIRVITKQEISQLNTNDIGTILDYVAGVNIETGTGSGFPKRSIATMNGFPAQYTLVLINGTKVLSDHVHTGQNMSFVPVEEIERIEIIKSAGSAQYGSDAIAGIINIITKKASDEPHATVYGDIGSYNTYRSGLSVQTPINEKTGVYNFVEYEESDGTPLLYPTHRIGQTAYSSLNITSRLTSKIGSKLDIDAWIKNVGSTMMWFGEENKNNLFIPNLNLHYHINKNSSFNVKLSYTSWSAAINNEQNKLFRPELWYNLKSKKNNLITGADFSHNVFTRASVDKNVQRMIGFFVQDEYAITEKLITQAALRMDITQYKEPVLTPKASILYKASDPINIRLSYSCGFHTPTVQELYEVGYGHGGSAYRFGNPNLKPEYSSTFALGSDFTINKNLFITTSAFYSDITNMIVPVYQGQWDQDTSINVWMRENILKAQIISGEIGFRYLFLGNYSINASYNYSDNIIDHEQAQQLPYNPGQSLNAKLTGKQIINQNLYISEFASMRAVMGRSAWNWKPESGTDATNANGLITELNDYQKLDAGISMTYKNKYTVFLNASNILGQDIENLDDAFTMIDGEPIYRTGIIVRW